MDENALWEVRAFIYQHFAGTTHPPSLAATAANFGFTEKETAWLYEELQSRHAILLQPGTQEIQMAWPFSAVETPFKVRAMGRQYFANCAWDSFGISAALHVDAEIEAACAQSREPILLRIANNQVHGPEALVHFLVPFKDWYGDLPST